MCIYFKRCGVDGGEVCFQQRKYSNRDCRNINFYKNVEILKIVSIISGPEAVGTAQNRTSVPFGSRRFLLGQILEPNFGSVPPTSSPQYAEIFTVDKAAPA